MRCLIGRPERRHAACSCLHGFSTRASRGAARRGGSTPGRLVRVGRRALARSSCAPVGGLRANDALRTRGRPLAAVGVVLEAQLPDLLVEVGADDRQLGLVLELELGELQLELGADDLYPLVGLPLDERDEPFGRRVVGRLRLLCGVQPVVELRADQAERGADRAEDAIAPMDGEWRSPSMPGPSAPTSRRTFEGCISAGDVVTFFGTGN